MLLLISHIIFTSNKFVYPGSPRTTSKRSSGTWIGSNADGVGAYVLESYDAGSLKIRITPYEELSPQMFSQSLLLYQFILELYAQPSITLFMIELRKNSLLHSLPITQFILKSSYFVDLL